MIDSDRALPAGTMLPGRLLPSSESPCRDLPAGISCVANHPGCKPLCPQVAGIPTSRRRDPCVGGRLSGRMALGTFAPLDVNTKTALRAFDHRAGAYRWCGAFSTRAPSALVSFGKIITGRVCVQILRPGRRVDRKEAHVPPTAHVVARLIGRRMRSRRDREPRRRRPTRSRRRLGYELHGVPERSGR